MAKRSRKERKVETEKRQSQVDLPQQPAPVAPVEVAAPVSQPVEAAPAAVRKTVVDFAQEYYYVYTDLRTVAVIAVIMFALMFGLGYFI
jgi:hypothetical protein